MKEKNEKSDYKNLGKDIFYLFARIGFDKAFYSPTWSHRERVDIVILNEKRGCGSRGSFVNKVTDEENKYICGLHAFIREQYKGIEYSLVDPHIRIIKSKFDKSWEKSGKKIPKIELEGY